MEKLSRTRPPHSGIIYFLRDVSLPLFNSDREKSSSVTNGFRDSFNRGCEEQGREIEAEIISISFFPSSGDFIRGLADQLGFAEQPNNYSAIRILVRKR